LFLERGALIDQHDVLHRFLLPGMVASKTNGEPRDRQVDTESLDLRVKAVRELVPAPRAVIAPRFMTARESMVRDQRK